MGNLKASGLDTESTLQRTSADQYGRNASAAVTGGFLNAGAAALSGYGRVVQAQRYGNGGQYLPLGG